MNDFPYMLAMLSDTKSRSGLMSMSLRDLTQECRINL